jgi:hypothetical protein
MHRMLVLVFLIVSTTTAQEARKVHPDYVPDQGTASRIAEAILIGQYGEEQVKAQLPLLVDGSNKRYWIVQGHAHGDKAPSFGGGYAVWIDKHSGCIGMVVESMK